jgi:hypothetical protein
MILHQKRKGAFKKEKLIFGVMKMMKVMKTKRLFCNNKMIDLK